MLQQLDLLLRQIPWLQEALISRQQLIFLLLAGLILLFGLLRVLRRKRRRSGVRLIGYSAGLVLAVFVWIITASHFHGYQPVHFEREVAALRFETSKASDASQTLAVLEVKQQVDQEEGSRQRWPVDASQWQLSARVISLRWPWQKTVNYYYRFQHFIAMPETQSAAEEHRAYRLVRRQSVDIWQLLHSYLSWLPWVHTQQWQSSVHDVVAGQGYRIALFNGQIRLTQVAAVDSE